MTESVREKDSSPQCRSRYCREHIFLELGTGRLIEMNCKSPRCERHFASWRHKWLTILIRETLSRPVERLVTLTTAAKCEEWQLRRAKQLLFREVRKDYGDFEYFATLEEFSETRLPHLHMLVRSEFIPQPVLSRLWEKSTKAALMKPASVVWIEKPKSEISSSSYMLKYMTKNTEQQISDDWTGRKISYSRNFFQKKTSEMWADYIKERFGNVSRETPLILRQYDEATGAEFDIALQVAQKLEEREDKGLLDMAEKIFDN